MGVLAFCEDGEKLAHDWSSGFAGYTHEETQAGLERQRGFGPTTCAQFHKVKPEVCATCQHWGKLSSPIVLGRGRRESRPVAESKSPTWRLTRDGVIKAQSYTNTAVALAATGISFRHDVFHDRKLVEGDLAENLGPELSDAITRALRDMIIARFGFDPGIVNVQQAAERACEKTQFDPVKDYIDALIWDGTARLDSWLTTYVGADDTPLNRAIGRMVLVAAVRRARHPGCKFDYILVLEGQQGTGKSTAIRILAGDENYSDQPIVHLETREQQEALAGVWFQEISELVGLRRTEVEKVKGFITKLSDNARPAYGKFRVDRPRRCILIGTTNDDAYLRDVTGNRRFLPVRTRAIDLDGLKRDRDQLFAEAAAAEARREPLFLDENLYAAAAAEQDARRTHDPWEDLLASVKGQIVQVTDTEGVRWEERISSQELLTINLGLSGDKLNDFASKRLSE